MALLAFLWLLSGSRKEAPEPTPHGVAWSRRSIVDLVARHGWPRDEVNWTIQLESGWKPSARNPRSGAVGLIQFMPRTLRSVGWDKGPEAFARLSAGQQAPYVERYFQRAGRWRVPGDTLLAVAWPGALGKPDSYVVAPVLSKVWQQNPAWRNPGDGPVTAGSIRNLLLSRMR